jgi:hypothetical protein
MKSLIVTGVLSQPFGSWPVVTQSDDGIIWDPYSVPWSTNEAPTSIVTDGTTVAISNGRGYLATSTDLASYSQVTVYDGMYISSLVYSDGWWIAAGHKYYKNAYGPYLPKNDIAQIHRSSDANGLWTMVWIHPQENSFIYQSKKFINAKITPSLTADVIVAVGSVQDVGDAWYSLDDGATWVQITIPTQISRLLSIQFGSVGSEEFWYWGSNNNLYKTSYLISDNWLEASVSTPTNIVDMASDDDVLLVAGQKQLHYTVDGSSFFEQFNSGYAVDRVQSITVTGNKRYLAFFRSNLTQYTYMLSDDTVTWAKYNNNITVCGTTLSP